jgi:hypothetical protein
MIYFSAYFTRIAERAVRPGHWIRHQAKTVKEVEEKAREQQGRGGMGEQGKGKGKQAWQTLNM